MRLATVCSRGLVSAMLILRVTARNPSVGTTDDDNDGCDDDDDNCTTSHRPMHGTKSAIPTSSQSSVSPTSSTSHISPASSSAAVTGTVFRRPKFATAGIVGATLGSLIVVGLLLMVLAKYLNRARKARKRPVGFVPAFPNLPPPERSNTETSQSQSTPLISSAVAARDTTDPTPPYPHSFYAENRGTNPSLSPLVTPAVPLRHSAIVDASSPSNEHPSSDASSSHEPLQSPYETSSFFDSANLPLWAVGGVLPHGAGTFPLPSSPEPSGLHREMTAFQKALEAGEKGRDTQQTSQSETRGSPPNYYR